MEVFIVILCLLMLIGLGVRAWRAWGHEQKRTAALAVLAHELGLEFFTGADAPFVGPWSSYYLFEQGRSKTFANVMYGKVEGVEAAIFDYSYITGNGKNRYHHHQTVVCLRSADLHLPFFALRPEGIFHKLGQLFGYQDIDFVTHAEFSRKYLLRGQAEEAVRVTFNTEFLSFLESTTGLSLDGGNDRFLYYQYNKRSTPSEVRQALFDALQVLVHLRVVRQA